MFHADDAFAVGLLLHTKTYRGAEVIRTTDPSVLADCDIWVDVGVTYDHRTKFDYHQGSFRDKFPDTNTLMSAAGLIYWHFGREPLRDILEGLPAEYFEFVFESIYTRFVQEIDAQAHRICPFDDARPNYETKTDIWTRVSLLNPHWRTPNPDPDALFAKAVDLVYGEFSALVNHARDHGWEEYQMTQAAYARRLALDRSGRIMELDKFFLFYSYLTKFENRWIRNEGQGARVLFVLYPRGFTSTRWSVRAVGTGRGFELRRKLPLAGEQPRKIEEETQIKGAVFSHRTGLMAIWETREAALEFARWSLEQSEDTSAQ
jgi:uncharacterized UPF0160 family protein